MTIQDTDIDTGLTEEEADYIRSVMMDPQAYKFNIQRRKEREDAEKASGKEKKKTCQNNQRGRTRPH